MVGVQYKKLALCSAELEKCARELFIKSEEISRTIVRLSPYSGLENSLKKLYDYNKYLDEQGYRVMQLARVMSLASEEYENAENEVISIIEEDRIFSGPLKVSVNDLSDNAVIVDII